MKLYNPKYAFCERQYFLIFTRCANFTKLNHVLSEKWWAKINWAESLPALKQGFNIAHGNE